MSISYRSNANIDDEDMAVITDWTDFDVGSGISSQVTFDGQSCMQLDSGTTIGSGTYAHRQQDIGSFGARSVFSLKLYHESIGTVANADRFSFGAYDGSTGLEVYFASDGLFVYNGTSYVEVGTNLVQQDTWQEWTFDVNWTAQTVDVYLDKVLVASGVDCSYSTVLTEGKINFIQEGRTNANQITYIDWFKAGDAFAFTGNPVRLLFMAIIASIVSWLEFDFMEYATNAAAQSNFVSNSTDNTATISQTEASDSNALGDVGGNEYHAAQTFTLDVATEITGFSISYGDNGGTPSGESTTRINTTSGGVPTDTLANANLTKSYTPVPGAWNDGLFTTPVTLPAGVYALCTSVVAQSDNNRYSINAKRLPSVYAGGARYYRINGGAWTYDTNDADQAFKIYTRSLQSYSESTIKTQGSYSLKAVATTDSINKTLTKTFGSPKNLSGKARIKYDIYASRTGSNISLNIHDSGGVTTSTIVVVNTANTWENKTWTISGVSDANKDAIDEFYPKIINAGATNTFYIDNVRYS